MKIRKLDEARANLNDIALHVELVDYHRALEDIGRRTSILMASRIRHCSSNLPAFQNRSELRVPGILKASHVMRVSRI